MAADIPFDDDIDVDEEDGAGKAQTHWYGFEEDVDDVQVPDVLPILPLRGVVVFPASILPLLISRESSLAMVEHALMSDRLIGLVTQKVPETETPTADDLYKRGCSGRILKMLKYPDGSIRILVQGLGRIEIESVEQEQPFLTARIRKLEDVESGGVELLALRTQVVQQFSRFVELTPHLANELQVVVINLKSPGKIADLIASNLALGQEEKQFLLDTLDVGTRLKQLNTILAREIELLELGQKIQGQVQSELSRNQKEFYLRQQLKAIQRELGEGEGRGDEIELLRQRIEAAGMPEEARKAAESELDRLAIIPPESAEHTVVRTYIEWLVDVPWSKSTEDNLDTAHAREVLDEDHFDLEKIKERILEFLAVRQLRKNPRGPILCLVGPPGVGKTSLGRSIARAMGRKFYRMSLGGVRDEAEIRGHRRTYVGAMPGRIIQGLKSASSNNPVFMLDEIDKLGADVRGDPSSALLEVLDPEQNYAFRDHYLDVPFDLSRVLFLTTANYLDPIPPALKDRMEVLELSGYSEEEKLEIAKRHLVPKQIEENGLPDGFVRFTDGGIVTIIRDYTREAGLRNLEREIGSICRKVARAVTEGAEDAVTIDEQAVSEYLGPPRFVSELADRGHKPGVAIGLAWTPHGGDILFIEAAIMPGNKSLVLTGQLGDVMKESAQAALTYLRSNGERFGIDPRRFEKADIHVHVPAGAIPKDGPSAGITMLAALASAASGRPIRDLVAMTGEITLRGAVLPVGGIKEKVLAARRAGVAEVYLPARNRKDLEEIEPHLRQGLRFHFVENVEDVLAGVLPAGEDQAGTRVAVPAG
ncbi:MAG: endopeptidase La [Deltaproteobacteria bacterium]|nr:MAG: endopeptidase La [Deltaproteobacteria bacterium]